MRKTPVNGSLTDGRLILTPFPCPTFTIPGLISLCVTALTGVVLLVDSPLVVLLPGPTGLAVVAHLLQQVEHSDFTSPTLVIRLTVDNVVQCGRRPCTRFFTATRVT